MDELSLIVEGIQHKLKKLTIRNKQLKEKISSLETDHRSMQQELDNAARRIAELEKELSNVQAAKLLEGSDSSRAKQKIDELLREIEKSTVLLNR